MDFSVAFALLQEGLTNGAVYSLIALALVMVFAVTRVILVQAGEFVSYGALTLYAIQSGHAPLTLWLMGVACLAAFGMEATRLVRASSPLRSFARPALAWIGAPLLIVAVGLMAPLAGMSMPWQVALAMCMVVPLGPAMYRLVYQPIGQASILVLLIVSVACHFVLDGLALVAFGPDGARTTPFTDVRYDMAGQSVSLQSLLVIGVSILLVALLFWFSQHTMYGRALRATASNRRGAALMGISADMAGASSFTLMSTICTLAGIMIAPFVTIYYNSGFLISLKAFVGATVGAMASYPLAAIGAVLIGIFESFAAFWSSGYKDSLVFALMVPILLGCSLLARKTLDEEEEKGSPQSNLSPLLRWPRALMAKSPRGLGLSVLVVGLVILPFVLPHFYVTIASYICLYAIVCYGVILLTGVAGQVSFGQAAFVGIAAYTSAMLTSTCMVDGWLGRTIEGHGGTACGVSPWLSLPVSLAVTGLGAWVLGMVTLRMRGHYLPIATIAWAVSIFYVFANTDAIGGSTGMTGLVAIPLPAVFTSFAGESGYEVRVYYLVAFAMLLLAWMTGNLLDSQTGRAIRALKSKSLMAESMGVNVALLKIKVFICAAVFAGLSGWLYAHMQRFINPGSFGLDMGVQYVFMAVIGGVEQVSGALLGAATVRLAEDWLQDALRAGILERAGNVEKVFFGVLIIVLLQRTQHGIAYLFARLGKSPRVPKLSPGDSVAEPSPGGPSFAAGPTPLLSVERVAKHFGGLAAVQDVSFDVAQGEVVALIGPNGAGKSTMFNLISGALQVTSGHVVFDGARIDGVTSHAIARVGLSRTFQHVKLLNERSALENVALGAYRHGTVGMVATLLRLDRREERRALVAAAAALERVGLVGVANLQAGSLPLGKQRVLEIARALASNPRMLLLDEPAAGLRPAEKAELATLLRALRAQGMAVLLVEHDMPFVMGLADRIVVQNFGRKIAAGTPAEIQTHPDVIAAYLGEAL